MERMMYSPDAQNLVNKAFMRQPMGPVIEEDSLDPHMMESHLQELVSSQDKKRNLGGSLASHSSQDEGENKSFLDQIWEKFSAELNEDFNNRAGMP